MNTGREKPKIHLIDFNLFIDLFPSGPPQKNGYCCVVYIHFFRGQ